MRVGDAAAVLFVLAACGRVNFEPLRDGPGGESASADDSPIGAPISVVQTRAILVPSGTPAVVPVTPTMAGSMLVVMTTNIDSTAGGVVSISDDASNTWVSADATYLQNIGIGETWFVAATNPGATMVMITGAAVGRRELWFLEAQGPVSRDTAAVVEEQPTSSTVASPPVTPASTPALIVTHINISNSVDQLIAGPFTSLMGLNGDAAAYAVIDVPGVYSATWSYSSMGRFSTSTVAFTSL